MLEAMPILRLVVVRAACSGNASNKWIDEIHQGRVLNPRILEFKRGPAKTK